MGQPGIGAMIQALYGDRDSVAAFGESVGKTIAAIAIDDEANGGDGALRLTFTDGNKLLLMDNGRSCCESRYMRTDDELQGYVGATLIGVETKDGPEVEGEYGDSHEQQFLEVQTSKGVLTLVCHNENNGYYGGFALVARRDQ